MNVTSLRSITAISALRPDMAGLLVEQRHRGQIVLTMQRDEPRAPVIATRDRVLARSRTRSDERLGIDCGHSGTL